MPNELTISTTTDSENIVKAVADNDEQGARTEAPKFDSEKLDGSTSLTFEHPRSSRVRLLEALAEAENDLAQFATEQVVTNEPSEEVEAGASGATEPGPDDEIIQRVREAAVQDAIQHARESYAREQMQAHLQPAQVELNELRAQALVPFRERVAELAANLDLKDVPNIRIPDAVCDVLITLAGGAEAAVYLAQHPEEVRQLSALPEAIAVAKTAALTARLDPAARRLESHAPRPIRPIGGSATKSSVPPDELSYQDFKKQRERDIKARRR